VVPAFILAVAAGIVGVGTAGGIVLAVIAVGLIAADVAIRRPGARRGVDDIARGFLLRALRATRVDDIAGDIAWALIEAFGPGAVSRAMLVVPAGDGVRVIPALGPTVDLGDASAAFSWLGEAVEPLDRTALQAAVVPVPGADEWAEVAAQGARDVLGLLDRTGCDIILPLHHRGLLLGVVLLPTPAAARADAAAAYRFWRALRAYATAAVARTFLGVDAEGKQRLARSLDLATAMQEAMMPDERPVRRGAYELRGMFRPVAECGGDLWLWHELGEGRVLVLIADATGHGAAPALLAAVAKGTIDARWQIITASGHAAELDPGALLADLNRVIHRVGRRQYLMTAFACVIDTVAGIVRFANAGQNFPYVLQATSGPTPKIEALLARGNALGAEPDGQWPVHTRPIARGDRIVLYTDGLIDAGTPRRDPFGEKRLRAAMLAHVAERGTRLPESLLAAVESYAAGVPLGDDVTILAVEVLDAARGSRP